VSQQDVAAIEQVIADIEKGFNTNDPELSVQHFTDDASAVSVGGALASGRDALLEAHRAGFAGPLRDQYARYELDDIVFLHPDVAVAHKRARATDAGGEPIDVGHAMIALYVFVKDDGRWRVVARQNTLVQS
jgi:uncharacterized protein (TIGR02246 family)